MPKCKNELCSKTFHACSSCCLNNDWEYYYCSHKCWITSDEYKKTAAEIKEIVDFLSDEQRLSLYRFLSSNGSDEVARLEEELRDVLKIDQGHN
jgi:hypothetical protein